MKEQLEKIKEEAFRRIKESDTVDKLNDIRVAYLGKKGELTAVLKSMKDGFQLKTDLRSVRWLMKHANRLRQCLRNADRSLKMLHLKKSLKRRP